MNMNSNVEMFFLYVPFSLTQSSPLNLCLRCHLQVLISFLPHWLYLLLLLFIILFRLLPIGVATVHHLFTSYSKLGPSQFNIDGPHILMWHRPFLMGCGPFLMGCQHMKVGIEPPTQWSLLLLIFADFLYHNNLFFWFMILEHYS